MIMPFFEREARVDQWDASAASNVGRSDTVVSREVNRDVRIVLISRGAMRWDCRSWCMQVVRRR